MFKLVNSIKSVVKPLFSFVEGRGVGVVGAYRGQRLSCADPRVLYLLLALPSGVLREDVLALHSGLEELGVVLVVFGHVVVNRRVVETWTDACNKRVRVQTLHLLLALELLSWNLGTVDVNGAAVLFDFNNRKLAGAPP